MRVDQLRLPCPTCEPTTAVAVVDTVITCMNCGTKRDFVRAPLWLVTGAPATGKSTIVPHLAQSLRGVAVFDTDVLGPWSHPDWSAWATAWLLVAHGLAQSTVRTVLCGYGIRRADVEALPPRSLFGPTRVLNLDIDADELRRRLRRRPGCDEARIERKVVAAERLRREADANVTVSGLSPLELAGAVGHWLEKELAAPPA